LYDGLRFKALGVVIFDSVALEGRLIAEYRTQWIKNNPLSGWNGSGIDSNDTEDARDKQKLSRFDRRFPINNALVQREAKT